MKDIDIYKTLTEITGDDSRVLRDVDMKEHTSFRTGGRADFMVEPDSPEETAALLRALAVSGTPWYVLGNGSNVLVRDGGFRGVILHIGEGMSTIRVDGERVTAMAGALLSAVASEAAKAELNGLEFASGIPGSIGGAVFMNAGAYDGEMAMVTESVTAVAPDGTMHTYGPEELDFSYRHSRFSNSDDLVLSAVLRLQKGREDAIYGRMKELAAKRRDKQPLHLPSAGSTFKRPEGYFAGQLIDEAGCRGLSVGAAQVSPKHAGFVVNNGGASAKEITDLIALVQKRVKENSGVDLVPEVRVIGEESEA